MVDVAEYMALFAGCKTTSAIEAAEWNMVKLRVRVTSSTYLGKQIAKDMALKVLKIQWLVLYGDVKSLRSIPPLHSSY